MSKNLSLKMGSYTHRTTIPGLPGLVRTGAIDPVKILTKAGPLSAVVAAYKALAKCEPGWIKTGLALIADA